MLVEIESFIHNPITVIPINKSEHQFAKILTEEKKNDWQKLLEESNQLLNSKKKKKKK